MRTNRSVEPDHFHDVLVAPGPHLLEFPEDEGEESIQWAARVNGGKQREAMVELVAMSLQRHGGGARGRGSIGVTW
ncbi:hypothetical protein E2562_020897 [Oryza meyeriana var. granulata]|uniref:Uncharacterized protein n=1 Tax=Oryza meyeriana var. granulata TaxID=110450 RepID=A0A6G1D666_9ORYZ|nr:hypothetical protein E2562_020897 [Oryza meyeriana var. granulata]